MPNVEIPLHLCQVLEEEFESMHETLDVGGQGDEIALSDEHGREVYGTVKKDWDFHENHVFRGRLADRLRRAQSQLAQSQQGGEPPTGSMPGAAESDVAAYIACNYKELLDDSVEQDPLKDSAYIGHLSRLLDDTKLFKREFFERLTTMRGETRALAELLWEDEAGSFAASGGKASDLTRVRRLLLEDTFPEEIRRAYDLRVARVIQRIHLLGAGRSAICLSGGGIRSGTFALGILQSLAGRGFLEQFDYLSTVSGGGYIGGWLSAWIHRHADGLPGVVDELKGAARASKLEPEPEPLRHLRDYSNFITPKTGILSADSWTFIIIYLRNLLLNWVVLVPLLASLLIIPRVGVAAVLAPVRWRTVAGLLVFLIGGAALLRPRLLAQIKAGLLGLRRRNVLLFASFLLLLAAAVVAAYLMRPDWCRRVAVALYNPRATLLAFGALLNGYAVAFMRLNRPSNGGVIRPGTFWDKRRDQNTFLWFCLLPLCLSATLLTLFWAWHTRAPRATQWREFVYFLIFGLAVGVFSLALYWLFIRSTLKYDPAEQELREAHGRAAAKATQGSADARGQDERAREEVLGKQMDKRKAAVGLNIRREAIVMVIPSLLGAFLLWVAATRIDAFDHPIVKEFGLVRYFLESREELLPYTHWWGAEIYTALAFPVYLLVIFLGITLFIGLTSRRTELSPGARRVAQPEQRGLRRLLDRVRHPFDKVYVEDEDREWLARASAWLFIVMAGWLFFSALVIFGPMLYFAFEKWLVAAGGLSGLIAVLGGRSAGTSGSKKNGEKQSGWRGVLASLGVNVVVLASFVFFACLVLAVGLLTGTVIAWLGQYLPAFLAGSHPFEFARHYPLTSAQDALRVTHFPSWLLLALLALALHLFGRGFSWLINLNKFSLHAGYRDRIIRAFLGASRGRGERQENPFTGFDPRDNLYLDELRPWMLRESDFMEPDGLASFVAALARPESVVAADESEEAQQVANDRRGVALYLHSLLENIGGDAERYWDKDSSESIDTNPSFRTALFGDLSRILPVYPFDKDAAFKPYLEGAWARYEGLALPDRGGGEDSKPVKDSNGGKDSKPGASNVLLNRLLLLQAFPDSLKYPPRLYRLMHVVNMALNLVGGDRLAWQQRRAESFTSSPLHSGSLFVGYRHTREYGGKNGISLGTAMAISGAAASSNMGYFSPSPFVTLALTFFNARLGWWLGNPGVYGAQTFFRSHPTSALSPILDEAFGLTDDKNPYVLLSDGGHFENLGLYEMVLRRCRNIVVVDGSADPEGSLEGLGDAVRKIRIDLGIPIEFKVPFPILPRPRSEECASGGYCAVGDIHYEDVDGGPADRVARRCAHERHHMTGRLVYIKPTIYGTEPRDIFNYAMSHRDFPHESTADQFFDEPQFESHRMLGYYILEQLYEEAAKTSPQGEDPCQSRDLTKFFNWLNQRAEEEHQKAQTA
ncbi:MAG: patatin-like phospholipase family protein [Pyrinomonadaceae bacterium]